MTYRFLDNEDYFQWIGLFQEVEREAQVRRRQLESERTCQLAAIEQQFLAEEQVIRKELISCCERFKQSLMKSCENEKLALLFGPLLEPIPSHSESLALTEDTNGRSHREFLDSQEKDALTDLGVIYSTLAQANRGSTTALLHAWERARLHDSSSFHEISALEANMLERLLKEDKKDEALVKDKDRSENPGDFELTAPCENDFEEEENGAAIENDPFLDNTLSCPSINSNSCSAFFWFFYSLVDFSKASVNVRKGTVQINGHSYQPGDQMSIITSKGAEYSGEIQQITSTEVWLKTGHISKKRVYLSHVRKGKISIQSRS